MRSPASSRAPSWTGSSAGSRTRSTGAAVQARSSTPCSSSTARRSATRCIASSKTGATATRRTSATGRSHRNVTRGNARALPVHLRHGPGRARSWQVRPRLAAVPDGQRFAQPLPEDVRRPLASFRRPRGGTRRSHVRGRRFGRVRGRRRLLSLERRTVAHRCNRRANRRRRRARARHGRSRVRLSRRVRLQRAGNRGTRARAEARRPATRKRSLRTPRPPYCPEDF